MRKIFHANCNQKRARVAILISYKIDFKSKKFIRANEGHYVIINDLIQQEYASSINIYAPNDRPSQYMKQKLTELKGEIGMITRIGGFNIFFTIMDRTTRQNISKEIKYLNNIINQLDLTHVYRTLYLTTEYTFFSNAHGTFFRVDYMLGHKLSQ